MSRPDDKDTTAGINTMTHDEKVAELHRLRSRVRELEIEVAADGTNDWTPKKYYTAYHLMAGMVLGLVAASASLLFNIVGAAATGQDPLKLIRVYLTFPMGEAALDTNSGFALAGGCCLYLLTGLIGGIPFHMILSRFFADSSSLVRFIACTVMGLGIWIINFYFLLSWLQPALIGGNWIVQQIPVWVAVLTHLVFGWTMFLVDHWGRFTPYGAQSGGSVTT